MQLPMLLLASCCYSRIADLIGFYSQEVRSLHGLASSVIDSLVPGHLLGSKRSKARGGGAPKDSHQERGDMIASDDKLSDVKIDL